MDVLSGKVAIITGAGDRSGIGAAYARALAEEGASVVLADTNGDGAVEVARAIAAGGLPALGEYVDVTDPIAVEKLVGLTLRTFGRVDILVNNAAIVDLPVEGGGLCDIPLDLWDRVMEVNAKGVLICSRAVVPIMRAQGGGKIINQCSSGAWLPGSVYRISKLAVAGITAGLAVELGKENIQVNAIAPGLTATGASLRMTPMGKQRSSKYGRVPGPRPDAEPEELCGLLVLLASPAGDQIHGQTINIDGGRVIRL